MKVVIASFFAALIFFTQAHADAGDPIDSSVRYGHYYANYHINADGTVVESHEWSRTVLKETALDRSKSADVSYSTSAQKAEVVAAYTLKANGSRINVPKDNYQIEVHSGKGKDAPVYSDWTTLSVVFPDLAVGDSVVFSYKITQTEPMFPGHYSATQYFNSQAAYDDIRVTFEYPAAMWMKYEAHGMKEARKDLGDRKSVEWAYANPDPRQNDRRDYSVFDPDKEVGYAISTFKSYADIAAAYGERAQAKAVVTERINKLAAEIVKNKTAAKEQARALYEWVATNITYAGNCIGIGAVVPRDLDFILDNKMGDCKDHATLLQALLAARGIKSSQALVNSGSLYRLPKIPVVANVNHVFNYLPALDLYVDSTSDSTPFGMLPYGDQDKPVLLVDGFKEGMRTPAAPVGSNKQQIKAEYKIGTDGSVSGSIEVFQHGSSAVQSRASSRRISKDIEADLVKNMFRRQGLIGSGKFEKDDPSELTDDYHFKASFSAEKYIKLPGAGALYIYPPIGIAATIPVFLQASVETEKEADVSCSNINASEEYVIELPKTLKVLSLPENVKVANNFVSYSASYKLKGNVLSVKRLLDDRTKGNVCSAQFMAEYKKVAEKAMDNLKEQVLYK